MKKETNILIKLVRGLIKAFALVIAQIAKIIYLIIKWFNNLNAKLFMKLPRLLRVAIIYLLIGLSIFAFEKPRVLVKEVLSSSIVEQVETLQKIKCDTIQGNYFSKPLPKNEYEKLISKTFQKIDKEGK